MRTAAIPFRISHHAVAVHIGSAEWNATRNAVEMAKIIFQDDITQWDSPVLGGIINSSSPLRYDDRMIGGMIAYARAGQVLIITPFVLAGAMSPITIASAVAQQNAEALIGIAFVQAIRPGSPVIYGGFTSNIDMKSGAPAFGTPEGAWALLVNHLTLYVLWLLWLPTVWLIVVLEERELHERFGPAYAAYCSRVPRFIARARNVR